MPPKVLLFVGAPDPKALHWEEGELSSTFSEPFTRYVQLSVATNEAVTPPTSTLPSLLGAPQWRSLAPERGHLTTGFSQDHGWQPQSRGASFLTISDMDSFVEDNSQRVSLGSQRSSAESLSEVLSQFYEESYARHEEIPSSQLRAASDAGSSDLSHAETTSFNSMDAYDESQNVPTRDIPKSGPLSNLQDFPNATYLNSIQPQVMTVNLIVGIIAVPAPRSIRTRRGANVELIETLVGDETKSGFGINFWLSTSQTADGGLRGSVESLRPQDVVLMRNVALSSFRGRVYGQSLRKGMTKVHLLHRSRVDRRDIGGCYSTTDLRRASVAHPQLVKARTVREWVLRFVGGRDGHPKRQQQTSYRPDSLPPDTQ
jgi:hypothetical protein